MTPTESTHTSQSPEETQRIAAELAPAFQRGDILALHGDLGAGKTCFVQGLAQGLGVHAAVNSPTYTLIHEYEGHLPLYHIDLYRVSGPDEALQLGLDEYLYGEGITAIEWAERLADLLPERTIHITLHPGDTDEAREITITREHTP